MLRSFKIGKLFGIPLYIHPTFFLLPAWMLLANYTAGLGMALFLIVYIIALFSCVVMHELGHALMARSFGIATDSITLYPIGGVARLERMSDRPFEEICIALAGPAVTLVIAALLTPVALVALLAGPATSQMLSSSAMGPATMIGQLTLLLWWANLFLLGFNLLPGFPMDGGRVLRAVLSLFMQPLRATEIAARVGLVVAFFIAVSSYFLQSPMPLIVAVFVLFAGQQELMGLRQLEAQRRAARLNGLTPQPAWSHVAVEPQPGPQAPFSGVAWDSRYRVWVQWHNGQPVAYWG
jgi:Zn-dependent protease